MTPLFIITIQFISFIVGTLILWGCSFSIDSPNRNLAAAALYNGIMSLLQLCGAGLALLTFCSHIALPILVIYYIAIFVLSFWLLMRIYIISLASASWLVFAMWFISISLRKMLEII